MASLPAPFLTAEQYVDLDDHADCPLEYVDGEVFETEAGTPNHARIQVNLSAAMVNRLGRGPRAALGQSARIRVPSGRYLHPDLSVVCGKLQVHADGSVLNPAVVFEILSERTADFDLGRKGILYRSIASLKEYTLIEQNRPWAQRWTRQPGPWHVEEFSGVDTVLPMAALDCEVPLGNLYAGVELEPEG